MRIVLVPLLALAATGCVAKSRYNALKADYERLLAEQAVLATELEQCREAPPPAEPMPAMDEDASEARGRSGSKNRGTGGSNR